MCGGDCGGTSSGAGCQNPLVDLAKRLQRGEGTASAQFQAEQSASGQSTGGVRQALGLLLPKLSALRTRPATKLLPLQLQLAIQRNTWDTSTTVIGS